MGNNIPDRQPDEDLPKSEENSQREIAASVPSTSSKDQTLNDEGVPIELVEALEELPPIERKRVTSMMVSMGRMSASNSSSLAKHVTSEHITQTLNNQEKGTFAKVNFKLESSI